MLPLCHCLSSKNCPNNAFLAPSRGSNLVSAENPIKFEANLVEFFKTNVVGNVHLFNLFLPLILKGNVKKVVAISSGMGDLELVRKYNVFEDAAYSISKTAMNMAVAKFSAEYAKEGVLFLSVCPGVVDTGNLNNRMSFFGHLHMLNRKLTES